MSQLINLDPNLFSRLPNELIYEICILTGKFILRYDKKLNKTVLVSIIDFTEPQWVLFNIILDNLFTKRRSYTADFGRRVTCSISRNGDLVTHMYLQLTLPNVTQWSYNTNQPKNGIKQIKQNKDNAPNKPKPRRGDKKRFKMQFK